jgi:hypothetical protein
MEFLLNYAIIGWALTLRNPKRGLVNRVKVLEPQRTRRNAKEFKNHPYRFSFANLRVLCGEIRFVYCLGNSASGAL